MHDKLNDDEKWNIREKTESSIGHNRIHVFLFDFFNIFMLCLISPCVVKKPNDEYVFLIVHNTHTYTSKVNFETFFQLVVTRREPVETEKKKRKSIVCMYVCVHFLRCCH